MLEVQLRKEFSGALLLPLERMNFEVADVSLPVQLAVLHTVGVVFFHDEQGKGLVKSQDQLEGWQQDQLEGWQQDQLEGWQQDQLEGWQQDQLEGWQQDQLEGWQHNQQQGRSSVWLPVLEFYLLLLEEGTSWTRQSCGIVFLL